LHVAPNAPNVIPGEVRLSIELRDLLRAKVQRLAAEVRARAKQVAVATRTVIEMPEREASAEALAAPEMMKAIEEAAAGLGLKSRRMPSGAGHDAAPMSALAPMGMIFVPSVGGVSHSPKEFTNWKDCAQGADVLLAAVLRAAG
jgi:N-carbamoyl-L-amino-acid hydrolase